MGVRELPKQNPTSYDFEVSVGGLKQAVEAARGQAWRDSQPPNQREHLAWLEDHSAFAGHIFTNAANRNDAYLFGMGNAVGLSPVYIKSGKDLPYYADFHIHLEEKGTNQTSVQIFTYNSEVMVGTESLPFATAGVFVDVPPSSIEEYRLLLDIGRELGVTNMPGLILPDPSKAPRGVRVSRYRSKQHHGPKKTA